MTRKFISKNPKHTKKIAKNFAKKLKKNDVVALIGDLGTGKTQFVDGILKNFNHKEIALSPTFVLVNEYIYKTPIYHFDMYRIELFDVDFFEFINEYFTKGGICLIEWADKIDKFLPEKTITVKIQKQPYQNNREIIIC